MKIYLLTFCILQMSCATELDFNQFENFVKNARTFQEEKKLISELKSLKVTLQDVKENIQNQALHKLQENLERISNWYRRCDLNIHKMTHFPTKSDFSHILWNIFFFIICKCNLKERNHSATLDRARCA